MDRRRFLSTCCAAAGLGLVQAGCDRPVVMTVNGPISVERLGPSLSHEHVMVDFAGAEVVGPDRYDPDEVVAVVRPYLEQIYAQGCRTLFDFTPDYLGRDPMVLKRLSDATGLQLVTNTGYYGARDDQHLPPHAFTESADALAARWVAEARDGIGGTGIRPGFIKVGVDSGPLSDMDRKLVLAGARTHRATGLTLAVHTGRAEAAFEQLDLLEAEGIRPEAWIWVHAQAEPDGMKHVEAARQGAWVAFDGIAPRSLERHVELLLHMKQHNLLDRVLISQDAGWYSVGEPGGGGFRAYSFFYETALPTLQDAGFTEAELDQLTVQNPARAFAVQVQVVR